MHMFYFNKKEKEKRNSGRSISQRKMFLSTDMRRCLIFSRSTFIILSVLIVVHRFRKKYATESAVQYNRPGKQS